ncbi:MAG: energy-coupling factor ABC transporter ATP-binding protein [Clostridiales bacterium]|nr:energy-coupling factor ABC transporter ATP-binding protein [Clostridiales bacterium]
MIQLDNLTVRYGEILALDNVSLKINAGERAVLVGANGAGKSTLLLAVMGVAAPERGSVAVGGLTCWADGRLNKADLRAVRQKAGMIFQNPDEQLFMPTVYDDVCFGPRNYGAANPEERAAEALDMLGIGHLRERLTYTLSGGEKRLAALAGVLAMKPEALLMDEPSSFLDPRARRRLIKILRDLPQTQLIATHDLDLALACCGRAIVLEKGRLRADGGAREVLRDRELLEGCGL